MPDWVWPSSCRAAVNQEHPRVNSVGGGVRNTARLGVQKALSGLDEEHDGQARWGQRLGLGV